MMRFLIVNKDSKTDVPENVVKILRLISMNLECDACGEFSKMDGGPTGDGKAIYQCPKCDVLKTIRWEFDI
jgi:hypothetical protein